MTTPFLSVKDSRPSWAEKIEDYRRPIFLDLSSETICEPRGKINLFNSDLVFSAIDKAQFAQQKVDENPKDIFAQTRLADYLLDLRFFKDAERVWKNILKMSVTHPVVQSSKKIAAAHTKEFSRAALCNNNFDRAVQAYRETIELGEKNHEIYFSLGLAFYYQRDFSKALSHFEEAAHFSYNTPRYLFYLALSHHAKGEYKAALTALKRFKIKIKEEDPLFVLGRALKKHYPSNAKLIGKFEEIRRQVDSVGMNATPLPLLRLLVSSLLGDLTLEFQNQREIPFDIHFALKQIEEDFDLFVSSSKTKEELSLILYYQAVIQRDSNRSKEAIRSFTQALRINPNLSEARRAKEEIEEGLRNHIKK